VLNEIPWKSEDPLIPNVISVKEALYFVWSLPVSVLITGAENKVLIREKIDLARSFTRLSENDRNELIKKVFAKAGNNIEYYKKV
jgi:hypothetical protein